MRTIEVSDEVYEKLERAASERGESVEKYLGELVGLDLPKLSDETLAAIDRGAADVAAGRVSTWDETMEWIHAKRPSPSAR